jgi:hypothetical protein
MNKFFTVSFKRELDDSNKDDIIDRFYSKLKEDWYNEISMIEDNRIIVTGDFFTLKLKAYGLLNAWTRIVKKAEVIVSGGSVTFTLDNSYGEITRRFKKHSIWQNHFKTRSDGDGENGA